MNLLNPVRNLFFPSFCGICSAIVDDPGDGSACAKCWSETRIFGYGEAICFKCGRVQSQKRASRKSFCHECDDDFYDLARACGPYQKALAESVVTLKTRPVVPRRILPKLIDRFVIEPFSTADLIVPIPLSKRRRFERGFNQAEIIADGFSRLSGIPVDKVSLSRSKHTIVSRASMDKKGRLITVRNAFHVKRQKLIQDQNILIIDDVFTSGATASMAAKTLKRNGAARVEVLTIARAGRIS